MKKKENPNWILICGLSAWMVLGIGCKKTPNGNDPLTETQITTELPGVYLGTVTNTYPGLIPYLIFNNIKVTVQKTTLYGPGILAAYPGINPNVDQDTVKLDTSIHNYWRVIDAIKFTGPRDNLTYKDSTSAFKISVMYDYSKKLFVVDYYNRRLKQNCHYYGTKISN